MFQSRPENTLAIETITAYLKAQRDGATVTWLELEQATGISCRPKPVNGIDGRALTRRALHKMGREVETITGTGFVLSCPENVQKIMADRMTRTFGTMKRAKKAAEHLYEAHGTQLSPGARDRITRQTALLATLTAQMKPGGNF